MEAPALPLLSFRDSLFNIAYLKLPSVLAGRLLHPQN
jgi:hypothetical protein